MSKENDPEKKEKTLATLDEGDLKLLQTYVREDTWKGPPATVPTYSHSPGPFKAWPSYSFPPPPL